MAKLVGAVLALALVAGMGGPGWAADAQETTAILDKAIEALGGEERLRAVNAVSWATRGTISFMGSENAFTSRSTVQGLDRTRQEVEGDFGGMPFKMVTIVNGDKGWRAFGDMRMELEKAALAIEKRTAYLTLVPITILPLKGQEFKIIAVPAETVGGKPASGIRATGPDGKDLTLYFDKESGLPVKLVARVAGFGGQEFTLETTFSDYQEVGGIQKATRLQATRDGEKFMETQISEFKVLNQVDPKTFAEPQ